MSRIYIARRPQRKALLIAQGMSKESPALLFPLQDIEPGELDELIRAILAKQGITDEATVQAICEKAEKDAEIRIKVAEARAKVRKLMAKRARGEKLMSNGFRKWIQVFYPATKIFKQESK